MKRKSLFLLFAIMIGSTLVSCSKSSYCKCKATSYEDGVVKNTTEMTLPSGGIDCTELNRVESNTNYGDHSSKVVYKCVNQ